MSMTIAADDPRWSGRVCIALHAAGLHLQGVGIVRNVVPIQSKSLQAWVGAGCQRNEKVDDASSPCPYSIVGRSQRSAYPDLVGYDVVVVYLFFIIIAATCQFSPPSTVRVSACRVDSRTIESQAKQKKSQLNVGFVVGKIFFFTQKCT
jgi:hypothetical protein